MKPERPSKPTAAITMAPALCLSLVLGAIAGCGDEASRMAGTIDLPERNAAKPDFKQAAADAKARAKAAKAGKPASQAH
ncbi:hypothetical protein OJF2_67780 [Aquisphaera giovannonii]|uniref:Lipoprotein n=1 Tax=Aquisphaera giovannonii TaxID=406548 RepID=A0A5B9WE58_9BACT|nr:hypothetical protein [Aquisphaera giovannonii]QEH38180.1 hypothetical protein OJF2_67780 [Aquisphaera giovannonii]